MICEKCRKPIKRGSQVILVSPPNLVIQLGIAKEKWYHVDCYEEKKEESKP